MAKPPALKKKPPYVGPRSIEADDYFFGRDKEIRMVENRLLANRVLLLHSLSGAGKTSLLQAGLAPRLTKEQDFHILPVVRVNRCPPDLPKRGHNPYAASVLLSLERGLPRARRLAQSKLLKLSLAEYLKERLPVHLGGESDAPALLIFDQFEEVLSTDPFETETKKWFFAWLMPALLDTRCHVLFAMRDDYIGGLEPYLGFFPGRLAARFRLEFLDQDGALDAIRKPAQGEGVDFKEDAARALADDLRRMTVYTAGEPRSAAGPYIEPMQLQLACLRIWKGARPQPGGAIELEDVRRFGSVDNAVQEYYDDVLQRVARKDLRSERALRDWIQRQLIVEDRFRFQAYQGFLKQYEVSAEQVRQLADAHLVRSEQRLGATWYELAHDRMVAPIVQANQRWREQRLEDWQLAAERWKREGADPAADLLLKDAALKKALADFNPMRHNQADQDFLAASDKARQVRAGYWSSAERRQRVRLGANLDEVGWGVIFPQDAPKERKEALKELLELRREQAGRNREDFFHIFDETNGYRAGESALDFLRRNNALGGQTNPENVPYYLLLAGGPEEIPFDFQYGLDAQYAVGRVAFDVLEQYQSYARSVAVCEGGTVSLPNRAAIFSPLHPGDQTTETLSRLFTSPLFSKLTSDQPNWEVALYAGGQAGRAALGGLLGGAETPAALVAAGWGLGEPLLDAPPQALGALVTADWRGPDSPLEAAHCFTAADLAAQDARLLGLVALLMGSYTAGAPRDSDFLFTNAPIQRVPRDTLARLPQALLGHPHGGALAVIAHVDRMFDASFAAENNQSDIYFYAELLNRLLNGATVGLAFEQLNQRYLLANSVLQETLQAQAMSAPSKADAAQPRLIRALDARNYILFGDPAARLPVNPAQKYAAPDPNWRRPEIELVIPLSETTPRPTRAKPPAEPAPGQELWYASGVLFDSGAYSLAPRSTADLLAALLAAAAPADAPLPDADEKRRSAAA